MIIWLFWPSLILLLTAGGAWMLDTFWGEVAGDYDARPIADTALNDFTLDECERAFYEANPRAWSAANPYPVLEPPAFLLRRNLAYPEDGC